MVAHESVHEVVALELDLRGGVQREVRCQAAPRKRVWGGGRRGLAIGCPAAGYAWTRVANGCGIGAPSPGRASTLISPEVRRDGNSETAGKG